MTPAVTPLLCPRDGSPLKVQRWQSSEYASCPSCHGLRVERSALETWSRSGAVPSSTAVKRPDEELEIWEGTALCSCAGQPLMNRVVRHGLTIDVCPSCGAFWFDAGEIERHVSGEGRGLAGERADGGSAVVQGGASRDRFGVVKPLGDVFEMLIELLVSL